MFRVLSNDLPTPPPSSPGHSVEKRIIPTEYDKAVVCSHARLRRQRDRQVRQLPLLLHHAREVQAECDRLKQELAAVRQQKDRFHQETVTLRQIIKLKDHPELAAAAISEATGVLLREEVTHLRRRIHQLECEKTHCLLQSEAACDAAEFYKELSKQLAEGCAPAQLHSSSGIRASTANLKSQDSSLGCLTFHTTVDSGDNDEACEKCRLQIELENERLRARFMGKRIKVLEEALASAHASQVVVSFPFVPADETNNTSHGTELKRRDSNAGAFLQEPIPSFCGTHTRTCDTTRLQRFTEVLRSHIRMLTKRIEELARRNVEYAHEVAALKLSCSQLRGSTSLQERQE